jgi:hypothetical protein
LRSRLARADVRFRVPPNEDAAIVAHGEQRGNPKAPVRFRSVAKLKDSSVVEQMTVNHRDAGSNPAPTRRFSLKN